MYTKFADMFKESLAKQLKIPVDRIIKAPSIEYCKSSIENMNNYYSYNIFSTLDNLTGIINRKEWKSIRVAYRNGKDFRFSKSVAFYMMMNSITYQSGAFYIHLEELSIDPCKRKFRSHRKIVFAEKDHFVGKEREWLINAIAVPCPTENKSRIVWRDEVYLEPKN